MSKVAVQFVVAAFKQEDAADAALQQLKDAKRNKQLDYENVAVVRRDEKNKLHIKETGDIGGGGGAAAGAVLGGLIGILGGPAGVVAGAGIGAAAGGVAFKVHDAGIPDKRLKEIGEALQPGTSAVVAIFEEAQVDKAQEQFVQQGADVFVHALSEDIAKQLAADKDVAYAAVATEEGAAIERVAVGEDEVDISAVAATDEAVVAGAAVITEEGATVVAAAASAETSEEESPAAEDEAHTGEQEAD